MWQYQHVLRDLFEAYQKVSILLLQTWTVSFKSVKKTDIKNINNREILDISNGKSQSFTTPKVENSNPSPLS